MIDNEEISRRSRYQIDHDSRTVSRVIERIGSVTATVKIFNILSCDRAGTCRYRIGFVRIDRGSQRISNSRKNKRINSFTLECTRHFCYRISSPPITEKIGIISKSPG